MVDTNKVLFTLTNNCRESTVLFFYLFNLFKSLFIISVRSNSFQHGNNKKIGTIVNVNPEFMQITRFLNTSLNAV